MPYKDTEKQKAAVEKYQRDNALSVKEKKAAWYQKNKAKRMEQKRELRRSRYAQDASALLFDLKNCSESTEEPTD